MSIRTHRPMFAGHSQRWHSERHAAINRDRDPMIAALYRTQAWLSLRALVLSEAHEQCATKGCVQRASVVDHVIPHHGSSALFFDRANLQALCKRCHDRKTAREDGGFGRSR